MLQNMLLWKTCFKQDDEAMSNVTMYNPFPQASFYTFIKCIKTQISLIDLWDNNEMCDIQFTFNTFSFLSILLDHCSLTDYIFLSAWHFFTFPITYDNLSANNGRLIIITLLKLILLKIAVTIFLIKITNPNQLTRHLEN